MNALLYYSSMNHVKPQPTTSYPKAIGGVC